MNRSLHNIPAYRSRRAILLLAALGLAGRVAAQHLTGGAQGLGRAVAAGVMAGRDGWANKIDPGKPVDKDLYELPPAEQKKIKQLPGALDIVLDNLEKSESPPRKL